MNQFPHLFSPLKIGNLTLRNRINASPTSIPNLSPQGFLTRDNIAYYELKAAGGAAVVTIGDGIVHTKTGRAHTLQIPLDDPLVLPSIVDAASAIKRHGAIPSMQLSHGGKYGGTSSLAGGKVEDRIAYGPSAETAEDGTEIVEMPEEIILEIVECYGKAAALVKHAGFEMVMVHAAHGWLMSQFLSPLSNKRTDKYGGSFENRARIVLMALDSVREAVGPDFPIEFRMNGDDLIEGGYTLEDGINLAKLVESRVDLFQVSTGSHEVMSLFVRTHPSMFFEHGCNVYLATAIKKAVNIPVACVGGISDPAHMEEIIASGQADVVELARALLADPYLPKKARAGKTEEITPCWRCFDCFEGFIKKNKVVCSVNPVIGNEYENKFAAPPIKEPKKVLIAGGGPGGIQAAITAAGRGHQVILCEKSSSLGGALKHAEHVPFKDDLYKFSQRHENRLKASSAVVMLAREVTPEFVASQSPDVLIAAIGATPIIPEIPGIDRDNVVMANDLHNADVTIGATVVILGGGFIGCESAIELAKSGRNVTIVEMLDEVALDGNFLHRIAVMLELEKGKVNIVTGMKGESITEEGVQCVNAEGKETFYKADTIICAVGYKALTSVVDQLRATAPEFYHIGDCVKPGRVKDAITAGYNIAMNL